MKIMHVVCGPGAGGAEVFIKDVASEITEQGHTVHVAFLQTASESGRDEAFGENFLADLSDHGIEYSFIGIRARKNPIYGVLRLRKIIRSFSPDIIHAHLYQVLLLLLFIPGVPVVFTKHSIQLGASKLFVKALLLRVSAFVAICEACRERFKPVVGKKLIQIDNGVDPARVVMTQARPSNPVTLAYVGRLSKEKNISMILKVCARLKNTNFVLRIAGEGPELESLKDMAETLGLKEKTEFLGNIGNVNEFLCGADVFLMASLSEGLPISLIEAAMSGLPAVVTDVGGCAEIVNNCQNGFSVASGDEGMFEEKVDLLISDFDLRKRLSCNALKYSRHYHIDRVVNDHLALYRELR